MPELPEIRNLSRQIDSALRGAMITQTEVRQEKCLNRPVDEWNRLVCGRKMEGADSRGKWCEMRLEGGVRLRLNLGMGGEFLLHEKETAMPDKRRISMRLADGRRISVNFWWFGSLHAVKEGEAHKPFDCLGTDALAPELNAETFRKIYSGRKAAIKTLLLDQKLVCGVGNFYSHDILFEAGVHPLTRACDLTEAEYERLLVSMQGTLLQAAEQRGAYYEKDLYNMPGGWSRLLVGYRKGQTCPACGTVIEEIKTGATTGFICPECQKISTWRL